MKMQGVQSSTAG